MNKLFILDTILNRLDLVNCDVKNISLMVNEVVLVNRLMLDVLKGVRKMNVIERSIVKHSLNERLHTIKVDTANKTAQTICDEIKAL